MNTSRVFTVFDKNGNEKLIFLDENNRYFDFDGNEIEKQKLDLETLKYFSSLLKKIKHCPSFIIKYLYNKDRNKLIETDDILIGCKYKICDLKTIPIDYYCGGTLIHDFSYKWNSSDSKVGLYIFLRKKINDKYKLYKYKLCDNLLDGKKYIAFYKKMDKIFFLNDFDNGFEYVFFDGRTLKYLCKENIVSKKKIYELAYSLKKIRLIKE